MWPGLASRSPPSRNPFCEKREASLFEAPSRSPVHPLFRFSARTTTTTTITSLAPTTYTKTCPAYTTPFLKPTHGRRTFPQGTLFKAHPRLLLCFKFFFPLHCPLSGGLGPNHIYKNLPRFLRPHPQAPPLL